MSQGAQNAWQQQVGNTRPATHGHWGQAHREVCLRIVAEAFYMLGFALSDTIMHGSVY